MKNISRRNFFFFEKIPDIDADELGSEDFVNVLDGIEDAFASKNGLIVVTELEGLVDPRGGPTGNCRSEESVGDQIDLDGRIASAVYDLARLHRPYCVLSRRRHGRRSNHNGASDGGGVPILVGCEGRDRNGILRLW